MELILAKNNLYKALFIYHGLCKQVAMVGFLSSMDYVIM